MQVSFISELKSEVHKSRVYLNSFKWFEILFLFGLWEQFKSHFFLRNFSSTLRLVRAVSNGKSLDEISSLTKIIIARPNWSRSLRNVVGNLNWPSGNELSSFVSEIIKTSMFTSTSSVNKSNLFLNEWATIKWIINEQFKWAMSNLNEQ